MRTLQRLIALLLGLCVAELGLGAIGWGTRLVSSRGAGVERAPTAPAILCIGDSCVWGPNFDPSRSYPARLEALLASASAVANANATANVNAADGAAVPIALNYGSPGRPSWEVPRDLEPLLERRRFRAVLVTVGVNNIWRDPDAEQHARWADELRLWKLVRLVAARLRGPSSVDPGRPDGAVARDESVLDEARLLPRVQGDLERTRALAAQHATPLYVVCYATDGGNYGIANRCLRRAANALALPLIDPEPAARELALRVGHERVYFLDLHPRPIGYEVVARVAYEALRRAGVHGGPEFPDPLAGLEDEVAARKLIELEHGAAGELELVLRDGPPHARCRMFAWEDPSWSGSEHPLPSQAELANELGADLAAGKLPRTSVAFEFDASGEAHVPLAALVPGSMRPSGYVLHVTYVALRAAANGDELIPNSLAPPTRVVLP